MRNRNNRKGGPAVECAFCLPLVILFMLATLEICAALFLKETLTIAAYEGARVGVKRRATFDDVYDATSDILQARGVNNPVINIVPEDFSTLQALDEIEVLVRAPADDNIFFIGQFVTGKYVSAKVVMVREFDE